MTFMICLFFAFLLAFFFSIPVKSKRLRLTLPPGPKPWPFFGCLFLMLRNKPAHKWISKLMSEMNTEIACFRLGNVNVITITSAELCREVLRKQDSIFSSRPLCATSELASSGYLSPVFAPYGDQWKKMKRIIVSELFSPGKRLWLQNKMLEEADHLIYYIYNRCERSAVGAMVNMRSASRHYCGNLMRRMLFGRRFFGKGMEDGGPGAEEDEHIDALFRFLDCVLSFTISDYLPWAKIFDFDGYLKRLKAALKSIRKFHDPEIEKRIQMWENGLISKGEDLLDVLITLKDSNGRPILTSEEIKPLVIEMMAATVDNPSNCVEWALAEMMNQPKILERTKQELDTMVGKERLVQESDLQNLRFIKACLKEAFRLHPIAQFNVPHLSMEDTTVAGYFIPKGSHIFVSRVAPSRNPKVWGEPNKFKPERHLKEENSNVIYTDPGLNMVTFGAGRRGCPGVDIGSTMTTIMFARLLQCFTWTLPPGVSRIELRESENDLFLVKPLLVFAKPRLARSLYKTI